MSDDFSILGINAHAQPPENMPDPESFAVMMMNLINGYDENGTGNLPPFTHMLAGLMMEIFAPGFIIIGSPVVIPSHDGIGLPADVGIIINGTTEHTATTVGHFLGVLAQLIDESAETGLIDLTKIYGENDG